MSSYLFSYGSLINSQSRHLNSGLKRAQKAVLTGYCREWNIAVPKIKATVLGLVKKNQAKVNGVVFKVSEAELKSFDSRELPAGYTRIQIDLKQLKINGKNPTEGTYYAYLTKKPTHPVKNKPVIQSYVDVVLSGCLNYGKKFAQDFIKTTSGWQYARIDDRQNPVYPRALKQLKHKRQIDKLMNETRN